MTLQNFLCSLQHFQKEVKPSKEGPVLLLFDNHESHTSIEVVSLCKDNGIHLLTFPPHCSHSIHPFWLRCFGLCTIQTCHQESFDTWLQINPGWRISILKIAKLCKQPYLEKLNPHNITAWFQKGRNLAFESECLHRSQFSTS